jgi:hypothetical protein
MFHPNPLFDTDGKPVSSFVQLLELRNVKHDRTLRGIHNGIRAAWFCDGKISADIIDRPDDLPKKDATMIMLRSLGFVAETIPQNKHFDHVLVLGERLRDFRRELAFLKKLYLGHGIRFESISMLGNNQGFPGEGESMEELLHEENEELPFKLNCPPTWHPHIESEMMLFVYDQARNTLPWSVSRECCRVPGVNFEIANTSDKLNEWKRKARPGSSVLVVSSNPHAPMHRLDVQRILSDVHPLVECVGSTAPNDTRISEYLDHLAQMVFRLSTGK